METKKEVEEYINTDKDAEELVDWTNPPSVIDLKKDLSEATPYHRVHVQNVDEWLSTLRADKKINTLEGRSKVQPKLLRKQNEWRYSALEEPFLSTTDMFKVNPVTAQDVEPARQNELILNKQFRVDIPRIKFINKFIRTAVNTGSVIVKVAWESETGIVNEEQMVPVFPQSLEEATQFLQMLAQEGQITEEQGYEIIQSGQWQQIPIGEEPITVEVEKVYINRPVIEVKDSRNVIIDPTCDGNLDNARFVIDRFYTDLSTLKKDGRYSNLDRIEEKEYDARDDAESYNNEYVDKHNYTFEDRPRKKLLAYEYWGYWDIHDDGIVQPIVATWVGDILIRLEENPYPDKKVPFVIAQYLPPDNDSIYGESDAALLKDNQDIIGAVTRGVVDIIGRTANAQQGIAKGFLDPVNLKRFKEGLDFEFNPPNGLDTAYMMSKFPELPRSTFELITLQNNEAESMSGTKAFSSGISGDALGSQVGSARNALDATAKRELGILRRLADALKDVGKKIIAMNSVWLSDEEIIRITDDEFIAIKRDDLAGNFDLSVDVSTAESDSQKANELAFMLQTIGQTVPYEITKIILCKIADLRKLPDLSLAMKEYQPQPDPMDIEMKKAQIALIYAQAGKEQSAGPKNEADTALKYAKAEKENAGSRKTHSEADQMDLNYVEQATGLQQDRDLEQINVKEQAKLTSQQAKKASKPKSYS